MKVGMGPVVPNLFKDNVNGVFRRARYLGTELGSPRRPDQGPVTRRLTQLAVQALPDLHERVKRRNVRSTLAPKGALVISLRRVTDARRGDAATVCRVRVAFWFPGRVANPGRQLMLLAPNDSLFFKEPHLVDRLRANLDSPVYHLPQSCNPHWRRPLVPADTELPLVIPGKMYPGRFRLLERLLAKGIPLKLHGGGFPRWLGDTPLRKAHTGRMVLSEDKARAFRLAAGVLNAVYLAEVSRVSVRLSEAAGCGAAVLAEFRSCISELFEAGKEVLVFRGFDGLVNQASRLLGDVGLTTRLGDSSGRRAHRDHSFDVRITGILQKLTS